MFCVSMSLRFFMYVFIIALTISLFANVATSMRSPQSTLKAYIQQNTLAPTIAIEIFQKEMDSSNYKLPVSFQALMLLDQPRAARWPLRNPVQSRCIA